MKKIAVLTNDLQYDLVNKNPERIQAIEDAKGSFVSFLNKIREKGHKVVHLQLINLLDDPNAERYSDGSLPVQRGTPGAEIISDFLSDSDIVIEKNKDSGFYETNLNETLQELDIDTIVVTGMQTQICVQTTAADAFFRGYNVWVADDCVVSARNEDKIRALEWLEGYCATVVSSDVILRKLDEHGVLPRKETSTL